MKTINNYIEEKLKISSKSKFYSCQPKDKFELRKILEERLAEDKDADLNDIDVSQITDMGYEEFPEDCGLFDGLNPNNIKINQWDVSNVENMSGMFKDCENFTGKGLENWDVSNVKDMNCMFNWCENFNGDLSKWDVSNVTNIANMFFRCDNFEGKGLENWNVSKVTDMNGMFANCENFNCDLSNWDVSNVYDMAYMFYYCKNFTGKGLKNWNVSNVKSMIFIFNECKSLKNKPSWYKK